MTYTAKVMLDSVAPYGEKQSAISRFLEPRQATHQTLRLLTDANQRIHELERSLADAHREITQLRGQRIARATDAPFTLRCGAVIDPEHRTITHQGQQAHFTEREWQFLDYLRDAQSPVPRAELMQRFYSGACSDTVVATTMTRIRSKLKSIGAEDDLTNRAGAWQSVFGNGGEQARYELHLGVRS